MNFRNKINANDTAYSVNQANEYDSKRFSSPSGKMIHNMELKILRYFLKLTSKRVVFLKLVVALEGY